jgi:VWFA-related protein
MLRRPQFAVLVLLFSAGALHWSAVTGVAQQAAPTFRAGVDAVPVYATVRDKSGHLIVDLEKVDFELFEDGRAVDIAVFSRDPQPLTLAVMLDASASVTGLGGTSRPSMLRLRDSVLAFMRTLGPRDRARLGSFGEEIAIGANLTNDVSEFERVLQEEFWGGGGTPLWQAIDVALKGISDETGRRVVLLYSDGFDTGAIPGWRGNRHSVELQAARDGAMVYFVRPPVKNASATSPLPKDATRLADVTGGGYLEIPADTDSDFDRVFAHLAEELRHQYLVGFSPRAQDDKPHQLELRAKNPDLIVRARKSFVRSGR